MIKIRRAEYRDLDSVAMIEAQCFPEAEAASRSDFEKRMKVFRNHFFVAQMNDEVIGFVNGMVSSKNRICDEMYEDPMLHNEKGKYQLVFGLDVLENYRRLGIASQLMSALINDARYEGRKGVVLTCKEELRPFYEKLGFQDRGISRSVHGGVVWYDMELIL